MIHVTAKLSSSYQITVPSVLRKALNLEVGDEVEMLETEAGILFKKQKSHEERVKQAFAEIDKWREGLSDESKGLIKKYAGWTVKQYHGYLDNLPETKTRMEEKYGAKVA